jgi:hypothetical protein
MQLVKAIAFGDEHTSVMGLTRHGKTYAVKHSLQNVKEGVFFFNTQHEEVPKNFIEATGNNSFQQIDLALSGGSKINFLPTTDKDRRQKELGTIIRRFYDGEKRNIRLVIDEAHLFKGSALAMLQEVATTGLRFGLKGVWLSQRGALLDNTLISQSNRFIFFRCGNTDVKYWNAYGFPIDEIQTRINNEMYHFCSYDGKEVKGAFKIGK